MSLALFIWFIIFCIIVFGVAWILDYAIKRITPFDPQIKMMIGYLIWIIAILIVLLRMANTFGGVTII